MTWIDARRAGPRLALLVTLAIPGALHAQEPPASPLLPPEHWGHAALARLHGAGLLSDTFDPATTTLGRSTAFASLHHAVSTAQERAPEWTELAEGYRDRFGEEFPGAAPPPAGTDRALSYDVSVSAGLEDRRNELLARHQPDENSPLETRPLDDLTRPAAGLDLGVQLPAGRVSFAAHAALRLRAGELETSEAYTTMRIGTLGLWGGRRALGFGAGDGGSVVLNSTVPFKGGGFFLSEGVFLPGPLRHLGAFQLESFVSRLDRAGGVESPWFFGLRTALSPHPRFQVGVNRGAMFGGDAERVPPASLRRIIKMLSGIDTSEPGEDNFEDHVASADAWFRPPLGALPLVFYLEWGVEDLQAQRTDMPSFVTGARLAGVPGALWLALGAERTAFGAPAEGRPSWYEHRIFGTWTDGGRLLAHPLGGEGHELRLYGTADLSESRLHIDGRLYTRRRLARNLFSPEREGSSRGIDGTLRWRVRPSLDLEGRGSLERGDGWSAGGGFLGLRFHF